MLAVSPAMAFDVNFSLDGLWDWGTVYTGGTPTFSAVNSNPYSGTTSQNLTNGTPALPDVTEDSYGILRVNQINAGPTLLFDRTSSPYELTAFFYGFDDTYINGTTTFSRLLSDGGHAALYQDFAKNYNPLTVPGPQSTAFGGGRSAGDSTQFLTVTDGTMVLDLTPRAILDPSGAVYTLENFFSFTSLSGSGSVLFDVTGGDWASQFDTNTQDFGTDIKLNFSSFPNTNGNAAWVVQGTGNARANVIPEPASMILMGIGLAGAARLRRRTA